jgi:RNA polymerase sigma-70 factor (ECF subfamily)
LVDELDRVYREQAGRMWRALTAYTGNRDLAQDAVSESFAQAIGRGAAIHCLERWVWKTAYRIAAGELKRRATQTNLTGEPAIVMDEPAWEIRTALLQLPPQQRAAAILHYYAGYPAREIAALTDSTPAAVWMSLSRGRRRLRRILEENDG